MKATEFRTLIKESIQEYIREIDEAGNRAALEAKIRACEEAINKRKKLTNKDGLDEEYHAYLDERKMKEMTSEIKQLEKSLGKYDKQLKKMEERKAPKTIEDGEVEEEVIDEVSIDENDPESVETEGETLNESFLHMQKLAGLITETEYAAKKKVLTEALNKDIRVFADSIWKALEGAKFKLEGGVNKNDDMRAIAAKLFEDPTLVYVKTHVTPTYEELQIWTNKKNEKKLDDICKKFQTTPYSGQAFKVGNNNMKQVVAAFNPGDIYHFEKNGYQGNGNIVVKGYARQAKPNTTTKTTNTGL